MELFEKAYARLTSFRDVWLYLAFARIARVSLRRVSVSVPFPIAVPALAGFFASLLINWRLPLAFSRARRAAPHVPQPEALSAVASCDPIRGPNAARSISRRLSQRAHVTLVVPTRAEREPSRAEPRSGK